MELHRNDNGDGERVRQSSELQHIDVQETTSVAANRYVSMGLKGPSYGRTVSLCLVVLGISETEERTRYIRPCSLEYNG